VETLGFGIVDSAVLAVAALGFTLQFSVTNYVNFAYGAFLSLGALLTIVFNDGGLHLSIIPAAILGALATAVIAVVVNHILLAPFSRRRSHLVYLLVVTFGLSQLMDSVYQIIWGTSAYELQFGGTAIQHVGPFLWSVDDMVFIGVSVAALVILQITLTSTRMGRYMRAIADDDSLALACGIPRALVIGATWAISGFLAGLAGVFFAMQASAFTTTIGDTYIFLVFGAVILGGIGKNYGAVAGAIVVGLAVQFGQLILPAALAPLFVFVAIVMIMIVRPTGLSGIRLRRPRSQATMST
jgi:branched-subunit amino acid ABC-type transport system permease component